MCRALSCSVSSTWLLQVMRRSPRAPTASLRSFRCYTHGPVVLCAGSMQPQFLGIVFFSCRIMSVMAQCAHSLRSFLLVVSSWSPSACSPALLCEPSCPRCDGKLCKCAALFIAAQVALGVCVAPLAISTAFTGVLFYDGKGAADVQVKMQKTAGR